MKTTSSERRLHPVSVLFEVGGTLPRLVLPVIVLVFATRQPSGVLFFLVSIAIITAISAVVSIARYLRFSYRYDAAELVIRSGILTRNERSIPYVRIQNLDAAQNPVHRLLGVAVVHVQTGGGAEPEASLRVLPVPALQEMRARVLAAGGRAGGTAPRHAASAVAVADADVAASLDDETSLEDATSLEHDTSLEADTSRRDRPRTLLHLTPRELVLAGFIENRGMVLIFGALALLQQTGLIERLIERLFRVEEADVSGVAARWLGGTEMPIVRGVLFAAVALLAILLFVRLLSTVWAVVRLHDFRLDRVGDELHTEYGLFTRVSATIPLRRVQAVIIRDGLLHRLLGRRAVAVETAGGAGIEMGARQREPIAPILRVELLPALLEELLPGFAGDSVDWQPVHRRAFGRMLRGSLGWPLALSLAAAVLVQEWALAVFAVLFVRAVVRARLRARHLGWSLTGDAIVVRDGALTRATRIARYSRVQVVALDRNPFDLRTGMASVRADTAGARDGVVVPYLAEETAAALQRELAARTEATAFTW